MRVENGESNLDKRERERRERDGRFSKGDPKFLLTFWLDFKQGLGIEKTNDQAVHKLRCEKKSKRKRTKSKIECEMKKKKENHLLTFIDKAGFQKKKSALNGISLFRDTHYNKL